MAKKVLFGSGLLVFALCFAYLAFFIIPKTDYSFPIDENKMNIVIVGDSVYANSLGGGNMSEYLEKELGCEVQNCSIGGTSATSLNRGKEPDYYIDKFNFYNVADLMITGNMGSFNDNPANVSSTMNDAHVKMKYLKGTDLSRCDYLIINYGINDGFNRVKVSSENPFDESTYAGALRCGIDSITKKYPNLKIVVCEVTYATANIKENGKEVRFDSNVNNWRAEYNEALKGIANEYENVYFFSVSDFLDVNENNYEEYLADGLHFNEAGKLIYSKEMADFLREHQ